MEDQNQSRPRWPYIVAAFASLIWIALAFIAMSPLLPVRIPLGLEPLAVAAGIALNFIAPVAILWLVATRLRDTSKNRAAAMALMAEHSRLAEVRLESSANAITTLEARLSDLTGQLTAMARPVERQHQALAISIENLDIAATGLEAAATRTENATAQLGQETPAAAIAAEALARLLDQSRQALSTQVQTAETLITSLAAKLSQARAEAADTSAEAESRISAITAAVIAAHQSLSQPLASLSQGVDNALTRTAHAVDTARESVEAQADALLTSVDQARTTIDLIGEDSARAIAERLIQLTETLNQVDTSLDAQSARAASLIEALASQFNAFDEQLAGSTAQGQRALAAFEEGMTGANTALTNLGVPVAETDHALAALTHQLAGLDESSGQFFARLGESLPATEAVLEDLGQRMARLEDTAQTLASPIEISADTVSTAQSQLEAAAAALEAAAQTLEARLSSAETSLSTITQGLETDALNASTQLIDNFSRIREIAGQSAGTMRETLAGVVAEAEAALDRAGTNRAATAFGTPIRAELANLESAQTRAADIAQKAAERITARLAQMTSTVADIETHFDKRQTDLEVKDRMDLVKRATRLLTSLQDQSIDLAQLLRLDIEDKAYDDWLAGDRSRFTRELALGLENGIGRAITRHMAHDTLFRTEALRYVEDFENLIGHVMQDRQGRTLATTLLASDPGKLYIALAQPEGA